MNLLRISGRVMEAVKLLSERVMPNFAEKVEANVQILSSGQEISQEDQNEFIDAARLVYEGVREIRRAVLLNRVGPNFSMNSVVEYQFGIYKIVKVFS